MSDSSLSNALIAFGIVMLIGALIAHTYTERIEIPFLGSIEKQPYRQYAFPLGIIGFASLMAGLASLSSKKEEEKGRIGENNV